MPLTQAFRARRFEIIFPKLDAWRHQMSVRFQVIGREALFLAIMLQDKEDFSVERRRDMEIIHRLVPNCHLRARHIAAVCPRMRFAFHQDRWILASEIETMRFLGFVDTHGHRKVLRQNDALLREKLARGTFEVVSGMRIAKSADPLKVIAVYHYAALRFADQNNAWSSKACLLAASAQWCCMEFLEDAGSRI